MNNRDKIKYNICRMSLNLGLYKIIGFDLMNRIGRKTQSVIMNNNLELKHMRNPLYDYIVK